MPLDLDNEIDYRPRIFHPDPWTLPGWNGGGGGGGDEGGGGPQICECVIPVLTAVEQTSESAPYTVNLTWTLPENFCDNAIIEIWRSVNGGLYAFWASASAEALAYENTGNNPAGPGGVPIGFKLKFSDFDSTLDCEFSNEVLITLSPV